jgi:EAL domain-containing protein (putative c-di-GMP-specific phosphodiesterase class I)
LPDAVNLAGRQIPEPSLRLDVQRARDEAGLPPEALVLELTESVLLEHTEQARAVMDCLKMLGVGLAIDDFGTGYSSLSYLHDLPIDILKIDLSFVAALDTGREAPAVVRSIIRLAGTLGLHTIAEGIERPEQAGRLRTLGADYGQGYHFAPPLSEEELATFLREKATSKPSEAASA